MKMKKVSRTFSVAVASLSLAGLLVHASSHREAPLITQMPKLDSTDFYLFNSYTVVP